MPANVPIMDEFNALEARVAALESGSVTPPDPPVEGEPSPDGTTATAPGTILVSAALNTFELCSGTGKADYGIKYNGTWDPVTHSVTRLYAKGGVIYQEAGGPWWYASNDDGTWHSATDPTQPTPIPPDPPDPPLPGEGPRILAAYCRSPGNETWNYGNGSDKDKLLDQGIAILESEIGYSINSYLMFPMWGSMLDWGKWNLNGMLSAMKNNSSKAGSYVPMVSLKPFWNGVAPNYYAWNDKQGLLDTANGMYDDVWRDCINACADNGFPITIFRLGYEDNFGFMCSFAGYSADYQQTAWKAAFERQADVLHDQAAKRGIVCMVAFCPSLGRGGCSVEAIIPNPAKFDLFACDMYNGYYGDSSNWQNDPAERCRFWEKDYYGWDQHLANAKSLNMPVQIQEHGAGTRPDGHGLANSANFWSFSSDMITKTRAAGVRYCGSGFWDIPAGDISAAMSNGAQPPCTAQIASTMTTFVGDPLWLPNTVRSVPIMPEPTVLPQPFIFRDFPKTPMQIDPATFDGRDPRAMTAWARGFQDHLRKLGRP